MSTNQIKYISKYNKENYKMYQFRIKKSDKELIEKLDNVSNRNRYITSLIKKDLCNTVLTLKQIKIKIKPVIEKHKIKELYLFGSYSRGEARADSDVDIYCDGGDTKDLFDLQDLIEDFENALGKKVDLVLTDSQMYPIFKEQLEKDKIKLFE